MESNIHCLIGIHTAGKTTIGRKLAEHGFLFFDEAAKQIARQQLKNRKLPWEFQPSFDEKVIVNEVKRDEVVLNQSQNVFLETWHFGNLAYARLRSPDIARRYQEDLRPLITSVAPRVYWLDVPVRVIQARSLQYSSIEQKRIERLNCTLD